LPGTNTLANLDSSSAIKKKSFITLPPGVKVIKLFFFVNNVVKGHILPTLDFIQNLLMGPNKLECSSTLGWNDLLGTKL